ncbi:putative HTH cro/C1-type domain-containing protein [Methanocaldococcus lauensis]|uniref:Putative HTH cro/C1-type domain-containing protein n=1 Tax=Methanocaldococcus lauensis TaxID=2546128 RepID=A0A8D6SVM3_9EURY|nr:helix-turn-helix domain-containing protein [Methanocaldococcus lauensis]CAB3287877.1 putative HTH cro/C1-type domain-containing protein [Methanocaldococcus lauensis]
MDKKDSLLVAVGRRISRLRKERGITLSGLAKVAGISKSTLSTIESGDANPTISTLWAIADALNVPFGELLPEEFKEVDESGITVRLIERSEGEPKIEVYKMILSPKSVRRANPHQKGVIEKVLVVSGSMLTGPVSSPKLLKAGEEMEFKADVPHVYMAMDEGATAIITIKYPLLEDSYNQYDIIKPFPENDVEWDGLKSLLSRLSEESLLGIPVFRIELHGGYTRDDLRKLKDILYSLKVKNLKPHLIEDNHRVLIYLFSTFPGTFRSFDSVSLNDKKFHEAVKILKLSNKQKLSEDEFKYLQDLTSDSSFLLSVLASEVLLIHAYPTIPNIILKLYEKDVKIFYKPKTSFEERINVGLYNAFEPLHPGYARQALFIAYIVRKYFGDEKIQALDVGTGPGHHLKMLYELVPYLSVLCVENSPKAIEYLKNNLKGFNFGYILEDFLEFKYYDKKVPLIISVGSSHHMNTLFFLEKSYDLLENGGILIVSDEFISPYHDRLERARNIISHHTKYMLETLVEIPENANLTDEERRLVKLLSRNIPLISYLAEIGEVRTAMSYAFQLFRDLNRILIPPKISHPFISYYIFQYLELSAMIAGLDYEVERKTYPERFKSLAEETGFSLLHHTRIYATHGANEMDAGTHIFALKKEG